MSQRVGRDGLVDLGPSRKSAHEPSGGVPLEPAAVGTGEQRPLGAFTDRSVDDTSGPGREGDEGGLVALSNYP